MATWTPTWPAVTNLLSHVMQQSMVLRHNHCSDMLVLPLHDPAMASAISTDTVPCTIVAGEPTVDVAMTCWQLPVRSPHVCATRRMRLH